MWNSSAGGPCKLWGTLQSEGFLQASSWAEGQRGAYQSQAGVGGCGVLDLGTAPSPQPKHPSGPLVRRTWEVSDVRATVFDYL